MWWEQKFLWKTDCRCCLRHRGYRRQCPDIQFWSAVWESGVMNLGDHQLYQLYETFKEIDADGSGTLNMEEFFNHFNFTCV